MSKRNLKVWHKIVIGITVFIFLILFLTPRIGRKYLVNNSSELLGRKIEINKIRINYFSGALRIKGFRIYELDKKNGFVSFEKLFVNLDYWPLFKNELLVSEISLDKLNANIEQKGEWFNFSDLMQTETETDTTEISDTVSREPMLLTFNNINLNNCNIKYTDKELQHTIALDDMNLQIPGFSLNNGSTNLNLDFEFTQGGKLHSKLDFNQEDSTYNINLKLDTLNIDIIEPYIKKSLEISEVNGYFSNNIQLKGNLKHLAQVYLKGWNKIESFEIIDNHNRNVLSFDKFNIDIDTLMLSENIIQINEIALLKPNFLIELIDSTNNWSAMIIPADTINADTINTVQDTIEEKQNWNYSLTNLTIRNGEILFYDQTLNEEYHAIVNNINIGSKDIMAGDNSVEIDLKAELNKTAQIITKLELDLNNSSNIGVDFALNNFAMKYIEPYLIYYFGYPINEGLLNFNTTNNMTENSLISESNLYVRNFSLGNPDKKDAKYKLPLKLVVGILSDKDNIIDLNIPVENKGDDVSIKNLGKIIFKTLGNLIVKAATSPVDFLANLYGVNPDKIKEIEIGMFDNNLNEESLETLDIIAKILNEKPKLRLELDYQINKKQFHDSLATQLAFDDFLSSNDKIKRETKQLQDSLFYNFLLKGLKLEQSNQTIHDLCKVYIGDETLNTMLDSTFNLHNKLVKDYLHIQKSITENRLEFLPKMTFNGDIEYARFYVTFRSESKE